MSEAQVGVDGLTGRRKINPEVLQNMREYLLAAEGGERRVREERVKKSVEDLANDPCGQRSFLRLEAALTLTHEVNQGKGLVFNYLENEVSEPSECSRGQLVIREKSTVGKEKQGVLERWNGRKEQVGGSPLSLGHPTD